MIFCFKQIIQYLRKIRNKIRSLIHAVKIKKLADLIKTIKKHKFYKKKGGGRQ